MSLKYTEKVQISRQKEIEERRLRICSKLEESKKLAIECDNLVKLRALEARCDKISKPRSGPSYGDRSTYRKKKYEENKEGLNLRQREKRQKIRDMSNVDIGNFFTGIES